MKNKIISIACIATLNFLAACSGDHPSSNGKDTQANTYNAKETSNRDTGTIESSENSATGGVSALPKGATNAPKDTAKKQAR